MVIAQQNVDWGIYENNGASSDIYFKHRFKAINDHIRR